MIEISLHGKTSEVIDTVEHPRYVDFPVRDSRERVSIALLEIAAENFVAPIVAALNRKTAIETYPDLMRALQEITQKHPSREDGKRVLDYLVTWGRPHPQARWHVAGADGIPKHVRFIERATMPRLSERSLTADPLGKDIRWLGEAERMDEMELDGDLDRLLGIDLGRWDEISGAALLQREVRIPGKGGGKSGGRKKPAKASDRPLTGGAGYDETLAGPRIVYGVRIPATAKNALQESGVGADLIAMLGAALLAGKSVDDIRSGLTP